MRSANTARTIDRNPSAETAEGVVLSTHDDRTWSVRVGAHVLRARRAVACLVEPADGDEVLVVLGERDVWVLSVLHREGDAPLELVADRDLRLRLRDGRLAVVTRDGVDVVTEGGVRVVAPEATLRAQTATLLVDAAAVLGGVLEIEAQKVRTVADRCEQVIGSLTQRLKLALRVTETLDSVRAGQIDWEARTNLQLHAKGALVTAREVVKLDAEQIHVG
jgi:hypothetical protein